MGVKSLFKLEKNPQNFCELGFQNSQKEVVLAESVSASEFFQLNPNYKGWTPIGFKEEQPPVILSPELRILKKMPLLGKKLKESLNQINSSLHHAKEWEVLSKEKMAPDTNPETESIDYLLDAIGLLRDLSYHEGGVEKPLRILKQDLKDSKEVDPLHKKFLEAFIDIFSKTEMQQMYTSANEQERRQFYIFILTGKLENMEGILKLYTSQELQIILKGREEVFELFFDAIDDKSKLKLFENAKENKVPWELEVMKSWAMTPPS